MSFVCPVHIQQCLEHRRHIMNICWIDKVLSQAPLFLSLAQIWAHDHSSSNHCRGVGITLKTIRLISAAGGGISFTRSTWLRAHGTKWILLGRRREEGIVVGHPTMSVQMALDLSEGLSVYSCALPASFQRASHWPNFVTQGLQRPSLLDVEKGWGWGNWGEKKITSEKQWKTWLTSNNTICKMRKSHTNPRLQNQRC